MIAHDRMKLVRQEEMPRRDDGWWQLYTDGSVVELYTDGPGTCCVVPVRLDAPALRRLITALQDAWTSIEPVAKSGQENP